MAPDTFKLNVLFNIKVIYVLWGRKLKCLLILIKQAKWDVSLFEGKQLKMAAKKLGYTLVHRYTTKFVKLKLFSVWLHSATWEIVRWSANCQFVSTYVQQCIVKNWCNIVTNMPTIDKYLIEPT